MKENKIIYAGQGLRWQFAEWSKRKRAELGLTQKQFGKVCGLPGSSIGRLEGGKHYISLFTLEKIAKGMQADSITFLFNHAKK